MLFFDLYIFMLMNNLRTGCIKSYQLSVYSFLLGQRAPFSEASKKGHVKMISSEQTINKMTTITEIKKVRVDYIIHPVTTERIPYNQAVVEGIVYLGFLG